MSKPSESTGSAWARLRALALNYPETHENHPWGHCAFKVRCRKVFLFLNGKDEPGLALSVKLPESARVALLRPFAEPTHYGLGRHSWVTATFEEGEAVPVAMLGEWIDESFRAIAPKTLVRQLDEGRKNKATVAARRNRLARRIRIRRGVNATPRGDE